MRTVGIIMIVLGVIGLYYGLLGLGAKSIGGGIVWFILGGFLIDMADIKKTKKEAKDRWEKGKEIYPNENNSGEPEIFKLNQRITRLRRNKKNSEPMQIRTNKYL